MDHGMGAGPTWPSTALPFPLARPRVPTYVPPPPARDSRPSFSPECLPDSRRQSRPHSSVCATAPDGPSEARLPSTPQHLNVLIRPCPTCCCSCPLGGTAPVPCGHSGCFRPARVLVTAFRCRLRVPPAPVSVSCLWGPPATGPGLGDPSVRPPGAHPRLPLSV